MSKIAGELNAAMTNAVRDKYRVLFAEMVRKTGGNQSVLDRLVQEIHSLREQIAELEASPLSEEALDILRSKNKQLEAERDQLAAQNEAMREIVECLWATQDQSEYDATFKRDIESIINLPNLAAEVLKRRDAEVTAAERDECAKVCDNEASVEGIAQKCAAAIRARSEKGEG